MCISSATDGCIHICVCTNLLRSVLHNLSKRIVMAYYTKANVDKYGHLLMNGHTNQQGNLTHLLLHVLEIVRPSRCQCRCAEGIESGPNMNIQCFSIREDDTMVTISW